MTTKTKPRAAQVAYQPTIDEARRQTEAQQFKQRVERVLLSADDLRDLGVRHSRVQLWKLIKAGLFPKPIKISENRRAWIQQEVLDWITQRAAERTPDQAA